MQTLWLYIHFPHLQLDSLFQRKSHTTNNENSEKSSDNDEQSAQNNLPIIVLETNKNEIIQLNQQAYDEGIRTGMGLATAAVLAPHLSVQPYRVETEEEKLKELAESLYLVTSDITLYIPNGILLRVHNMLSLYGGLTPYWQVVQKQLSPHNLRYHYATGHSPLAARLFSRSGFDHISANIDWLKQRVNDCLLTQTDLPTKTVEQLKRVGTKSLGELLSISRKSIAKRFNIDLINYLGRLTGEFHHSVEFFHPKESFSRHLELLFDIDHVQPLIKPLFHILNTLEQFMTVRDQVTYSLRIVLHQRDSLPLELTVGSAQGEYQAKEWLTLIKLKLENLALNAPVFAIHITTGVVQQRSAEINDLFNKQSSHLSYAQLISLLTAKLGETTLLQPAVNDDHRPEYAVTHTQPSTSKSNPVDAQILLSLGRFRPSFLLQIPQPLHEQTTLLHGPERISSGWWEHASMTRDYYIARSEQGRFYWVYKTPKQKWFLHGVFS